MDRTTDLETIRRYPSRFTWGRIEQIHDVGRYTIVEFIDRPPLNEKREGERCFHVYVDGKDKSRSAATMDRALLVAIALGNMEVNAARWAAEFAEKMMGL